MAVKIPLLAVSQRGISLVSEGQGAVPHATGGAHGSECCRQNRDGELYHRLPKFFVFHSH